VELRFWKKPGSKPGRVDDAEENGEPGNDAPTCPSCGAKVEVDAKFCTNCSSPLGKEGRKKVEEAEAVAGLKPWAVKAGARISAVPWRVWVGVLLTIVIIIAIIVSLLVVASGHSPSAAVDRYLSRLKQGDLKGAYELVAQAGGRFSSFGYFSRWQGVQAQELGRLKDYKVKPRKTTGRLFGHLLSEEPVNSTPFVATLIYKNKSFDININAEDAGGVWPANKYLLRLSEDTTRVLCSPVGSKIYIDDGLVGRAVEDKALKDALSLGDLPKDVDGAIEYARKLVRTAQNAVDEFKRIARELDKVVESAQRIADRFGAAGMTWTDVMDAVDSTVQQSKELGADIARTAIHIYWLFGGGDDGSMRARLTRAQTGLDLNNLPEGYHVIRAELPGCKPVSKSFYAPEGSDITLEPDALTEIELKATMDAYYAEHIKALNTLNTAGLSPVCTGDLFAEENAKVADLTTRGLHVVSGLSSLKYNKMEMLAEDVATVETEETWNINTYRGAALVSATSGVKQKAVYTLVREVGTWKVAERKVD
jgi:hypothetical protein